ncbi:transposase, partial [Myroides marinus]
LKANNKFNRFTLRSLPKVNIEFGLMAIAHNLRKIVTNRA